MKHTRIKQMKYKGYLIKPAITGFRVFRKEYFVAEYATLQIARARIDKVIRKKQKLLGTPESDTEQHANNSRQIDLF